MYGIRRIRLIAYAAVALLAAPIAVAQTGGTTTPKPKTRKCFPLRVWTPPAYRGDRPCAHIAYVAEDGSVRVVVKDADGDWRYKADIGARDR